MIKAQASVGLSSSLSTGNHIEVQGTSADEIEFEEDAVELRRNESSLDYLCNLSTHR